ncbi:CaiB/BaiF CoA-transferase family protein [Sphingomonas sp. 28-63-12]|uniref:CaiB/BaiF CoA transferase family protein n=1 Tax=Sphingomonas sp. 28-63-12 TaxID=1970434 RepID=UPI000BCE02AC|nr:MAG: carnitine dehydratase [Sphingomonas sp. 28-63-12]
MIESSGGPLSGIRIVEFDAIGPVPLAAMILADMGADIVRLARPAGAVTAWDDVGGSVLHRSRSVVHVDLKNPDDRAQVLDLIARADAVVEGFRPGVMERLGIGPDIGLARNPKLIFARMTGWGQSGPLALRAGHDINYIAITGALHAIGKPDEPPTVPLNLVGDYGGGAMFLVAGVLAALLAARTTGRGQIVDVAMTEGAATLLSMFHSYHATGSWQDQREANLLDGGAPFYRCYACADGRHVAVGCLEPQFFAACLQGLGLDPQLFRQNDRATWPAMRAEFETTFKTRTRDAWAALFAETDACVSPVLTLAEAPDHPHNRHRTSFVTRDGVSQAAPAPKFAPDASIVREPSASDVATAVARWNQR